MKPFFSVFALAALLPLCGCPSSSSTQLQSIALASQNAAIVVQNLQKSEIAAYQANLIPASDHVFIEKEVLALSQLGATTDTCIRNAGSTAGALTCLQSTSSTIAQMQLEGATGLKSQQAQDYFSIALSGVQAAILAVETTTNPTAPATPAAK